MWHWSSIRQQEKVRVVLMDVLGFFRKKLQLYSKPSLAVCGQRNFSGKKKEQVYNGWKYLVVIYVGYKSTSGHTVLTQRQNYTRARLQIYEMIHSQLDINVFNHLFACEHLRLLHLSMRNINKEKDGCCFPPAEPSSRTISWTWQQGEITVKYVVSNTLLIICWLTWRTARRTQADVGLIHFRISWLMCN